MTNELKIALLQSNLVWENPEQNRLNFSAKINSISNAVDIIVLPEMFTTGFTMTPENVAETMNGKSILWMQKMANKHQLAITGSIVIKENNTYYNRLVFVHPSGKIETYDKRHLFTLAGEDQVYASGSEKQIVHYKNWRICPLICYDLRFPVWARNTQNYDVLLYVANWPERRITAWDALLKARSIENMTYCIGVNRTGKDGNDHQYIGHSAVYNVLGKRLSNKGFEEDFIETIKLEKSHIESNRKHLQFLNDRDEFTLK